MITTSKERSPRLYPIRTSANAWNIKLYSKHLCSEECCLSFLEDDFGMMIVPNPLYFEGKCPYSSMIHLTVLKLCDFDKNNPIAIDGPLISGESIVIPDTKIQIELTFPLKTPKKISIESQTSLGFSLTEIITTLSIVYKKIYEEEEKTSSEKNHIIIQPCECLFIPNSEKIPTSRREIPFTKDDFMCSICLESPIESDVKEKISKTLCGHIFHTSCLDIWLSDNKKCPLCRDDLMKCDVCEGSERITVEYRGKIIPQNIRGMFLGRNTTDGYFGIHSHDFEDLYVENFFYNNISKILYPKIIC
jgi:hypothetical protein